jgi:hypothetical protein
VLDRLSDSLPVMPEESGPAGVGARRADALVALCSSGDEGDRDPTEPRWSCTRASTDPTTS